jgi:hypothetical protein
VQGYEKMKKGKMVHIKIFGNRYALTNVEQTMASKEYHAY